MRTGCHPGKRFAVIADEAHNSQTGKEASKLKQVLTPKNNRGWPTVARLAAKTFWPLKWQRELRTSESRTSPLQRLPRPKRWSFLAAVRILINRRAKITCPNRFTSTRCARPSKRALFWTCCVTTRLRVWPSNWPVGVKNGTTSRAMICCPSKESVWCRS